MNLIFQLILVISLLSTISFASIDEDCRRILIDAERGRKLNNVVTIKRGGFLGSGGYGFALQGDVKRIKSAFKFFHISHRSHVDREYKIYACLGSIGNPSIVLWGVPALHYRGILKDRHGREIYDILGISLLGKSVKDYHRSEGVFDRITILLILQKMTKKLKYIHGCNVIHNDIKPDNILVLCTEVVVIDYNGAKLTNDFSDREVGSDDFASLSFHEGRIRKTKDDFESLYYTMLELAGIRLPWKRKRRSELIRYKRRIKEVRALIEIHPSPTVIRVFQEFYDEITSSNRYFRYDYMYAKIGRAIETLANSTTQQFFQWATGSDIEWARERRIPLLQEIRGPPQTLRNITIPPWPNQH